MKVACAQHRAEILDPILPESLADIAVGAARRFHGGMEQYMCYFGGV